MILRIFLSPWLNPPPEFDQEGRGVNWTPLDFYKVITQKAFDLEWPPTGWSTWVGDAPKETCLNFRQQCFKWLYFKQPMKLNYRRLEEGRIFLLKFWEKILLFTFSPLMAPLIFNSKNKHGNCWQSLARKIDFRSIIYLKK